jgi:hypothetical protein
MPASEVRGRPTETIHEHDLGWDDPSATPTGNLHRRTLGQMSPTRIVETLCEAVHRSREFPQEQSSI